MEHLRNEGRRYVDPALNAKLDRVPYLGKFDDKDSYNGRPPGAAVHRAGWRVVSVEREAWYHKRGQLVGGRILAGDTSYKFTKKIKMDGTRVFQGSHTVMNEHSLVVLQVSAAGNRGPEG